MKNSKAKGGLAEHFKLEKIKQSWQLYVMLALPLIYILVFQYEPMLGVQIAFRKYNVADGIWGSKWVGLYQFRKIFSSPKFWQVFKNTLILSFYSLVVAPPITILFAMLLNTVRSTVYKKTVQMLTYMPHFISVVVLVGIIIQLLNPRIGLYGQLCTMLGTEAEDIFSSSKAFPHLYVWSNIWQNLGWGSVIYIAALSSVDTELYDAAEVDGANRFKRMIHIDFPAILPTATIMIIMRVGRIMSVGYEKVLLMQNSLNISTSEIIGTYSYKVGLQSGSDYSYGAAIGLMNSVINLVMIMMVNRLAKKISDTSLW